MSEEAKEKAKRNTIDEYYQAWIQSQEYTTASHTTCSFTDWKSGRLMHFLGLNQFYAYLILRYKDYVLDIYEQYPLNLDETNNIADSLGYKRFNHGTKRMLTHLLVKDKSGHYIAYFVTSSRKSLDPVKHRRVVEKCYIEYQYWKSHNIPWRIIFTDQFVNKREAINIKICSEFWNKDNVRTKEELLKHLIIHRAIIFPLSQVINFNEEASEIITDDLFEKYLENKKF